MFHIHSTTLRRPIQLDATRLAGVVLLTLSLSLSVGCTRQAAELPKSEPPKVTVATPIETELVDYAEFSGYIDAVDSVELRSQVGGYLNTIAFEDGSEVKKGDLLFLIDPRLYQAKVDQAKAALTQSEARTKQMKADLDRTTALMPSGAATQADLDKATADYEESVAQVEVKKAELASVELNLEYSKVTAPMDGCMDRHLVSVGNLVTANVTQLANMISVDPMYLYFTMDEHILLELQKRVQTMDSKKDKDGFIPAYFGLLNEKATPNQAKVDFFATRVSPSSGTLEVRAIFDNPKNEFGRRKFVTGTYVRVRVPTCAATRKILVPEAAIRTNQSLKYLMVVNAKNEVESRSITPGRLEGTLRVIEEGITTQDKVVINGLQRARPGIVVTPEAGKIEPPATSASMPIVSETKTEAVEPAVDTAQTNMAEQENTKSQPTSNAGTESVRSADASETEDQS